MSKGQKLVFWVCLGFGILIFGFILSSCSEIIESRYFYYSPSWTRDGKIIFIKGLQSTKKSATGSQLSSTYTQTLMTMSAAGTNETVLFDVTDAIPYSVSYTPTADYIAYLDGLRNGLFSKIVVKNIGAPPHTGLENAELLFSPGIVSFDWSNDGTRFVYCTTNEVRLININGTGDSLITGETDLSYVTWKYGTKIAFVHTAGANTILSLINSDGTGRVDLSPAAAVDKPQISSVNNNIIYGLAGGSYCSVDLSAGTPGTTEVSGNFSGNLPFLSPDGSAAVYSKTGQESGIYLLNISTEVESIIKE